MFKPRFARLVEARKKMQTIRRRAGCVPGDVLSLREWSGAPYRSKHRLLDVPGPVVCSEVLPVVVHGGGVRVGGFELSAMDKTCLAHADGFGTYAEMMAFFSAGYGLPFTGEIVGWG